MQKAIFCSGPEPVTNRTSKGSGPEPEPEPEPHLTTLKCKIQKYTVEYNYLIYLYSIRKSGKFLAIDSQKNQHLSVLWKNRLQNISKLNLLIVYTFKLKIYSKFHGGLY